MQIRIYIKDTEEYMAGMNQLLGLTPDLNLDHFVQIPSAWSLTATFKQESTELTFVHLSITH